jgi:hypothetical protein
MFDIFNEIQNVKERQSRTTVEEVWTKSTYDYFQDLLLMGKGEEQKGGYCCTQIMSITQQK